MMLMVKMAKYLIVLLLLVGCSKNDNSWIAKLQPKDSYNILEEEFHCRNIEISNTPLEKRILEIYPEIIDPKICEVFKVSSSCKGIDCMNLIIGRGALKDSTDFNFMVAIRNNDFKILDTFKYNKNFEIQSVQQDFWTGHEDNVLQVIIKRKDFKPNEEYNSIIVKRSGILEERGIVTNENFFFNLKNRINEHSGIYEIKSDSIWSVLDLRDGRNSYSYDYRMVRTFINDCTLFYEGSDYKVDDNRIELNETGDNSMIFQDGKIFVKYDYKNSSGCEVDFKLNHVMTKR